MATKVHMEALSPTMEEGQLVRWLKQKGDQVAEGDILAEIETDKATMELVARGSGVLREQLLAEGQTAPVGAVIGVIAAPDEDIAGIVGEVPTTAASPARGLDTEHEPEAGKPARTEGEREMKEAAEALADNGQPEADQANVGVQAAAETPGLPPTPAVGTSQEEAAGGDVRPVTTEGDGAGEAGRLKASPLARRLAAESGMELRGIEGSGPGGRIVKRDIEAARTQPAAAPAARPAAPAAAGAAPPRPAAYEGPDVEGLPVSQMRKTIAKRLVTSIGPIPTFYLTVEVDMTRMAELRERINQRLAERGEKASVNDLLIKATAMALRQHPEVNASWGETVIRRYHRVHVGVAVAVEDGLITPVVRDADRKGVAEIAREVRELAGRARERKLTPEEYTGATFSISNLGMFGIEEFTAIINPPESAILAVGRAEDKPVVEDGQVVVRPRMRMTMSCDHRVVDGATGARFLQTLRAFIEEPMMMLQ